MIIDEYVKVVWHPTNKKFFVDKGYKFTHMGDEFSIKVKDLKLGSHVIIHVKCDVCGNEKYLTYKTYNKNIKNGGYYGCSNQCSINKYYETNLNLYGNKIPMNNISVKEKMKKTNLERYGVECTLQSEIVKVKAKNTTLKKFGVKHNSQSDRIKLKKKETALKNFGVESYFLTKEFKEKSKETNLIKFGTIYPTQSEIVKQKIKKTNLKRYGVESPLLNNEIRTKIKNTFLRKYGVEFLHQNKEISKKAQNTMIERYGELWLKHCPTYNSNSIIYLDLISEKLDINIQHALNGGEKKFVKYWVDGYIEEYNICLEWDEKYHKQKKFKEKDIIKEQFLLENFGCSIIRINEIDFLNDTDNQINTIINQINNIIRKKHGK